jgi:hypothetical protein
MFARWNELQQAGLHELMGKSDFSTILGFSASDLADKKHCRPHQEHSSLTSNIIFKWSKWLNFLPDQSTDLPTINSSHITSIRPMKRIFLAIHMQI